MDKESFDGAGGIGGAGCAGGAGWPVRSEGRRGGEPGRIALGSQGIIIGRRLDEEEKGTSLRLLVRIAVPGRGGREEAGLIRDEEDEACCCCFCILGEIDLGILANDDEDCGCCSPLFAIIGLTSVKLDVRGSKRVLEFPGDDACSGMVEAILSCLGERDLERERERLRLCLGYPESRRYPGEGDLQSECRFFGPP